MDDESMELLFRAMGKILNNQSKIMRHLGITKYDSSYGWDDERTTDLENECYSNSRAYEQDN